MSAVHLVSQVLVSEDPPGERVVDVGEEDEGAKVDCDGWRQLYKNRSSRTIDFRRLFSREYDFPKTFSLTENQFSGKAFFIQFIPDTLRRET